MTFTPSSTTATAVMRLLPGMFLVVVGCSTAVAQSPPSRLDRGFDQSFRAASKPVAGLTKLDGDEGGDSTPIAGTAVYTGAAALGGYDSNLDLASTNPKGSAFYGIEGGAGAIVGRGGAETTVAVRGREEHYNLNYRPDRFDIGAFADHYAALENGRKLTVGGFYYQDEIDTDRSRRLAGYVNLEQDRETTDTFLRVRTLNRHYLNAVGTSLPSGTLTDVDTSFSNTRTELAFGALVMKDRRVAPFLQVGLASIDFTDQLDTAVLNRNSREAFAITGIKIRFSDKLFTDIGVRANTRELSDPTLRHHSSAFFDGRVSYEPSPFYSLEFNVDRTNQDPLTTRALFSEETAARLSIVAKPTLETHLTFETGLVRQDQIGASKHFDEVYVEGKVSHALTRETEIFAFTKLAQESDNSNAEKAKDARFGIGLKIHN